MLWGSFSLVGWVISMPPPLVLWTVKIFLFKLRSARLSRRIARHRDTAPSFMLKGITVSPNVWSRYSRNRSRLLEAIPIELVGFSNGSHTPFNDILESFIANRAARAISQLQGPRSVLRNSLLARHTCENVHPSFGSKRGHKPGLLVPIAS